MKKMLCFSVAALISCVAIAQDSAWRHVSITVIPRVLSNKINVEVDYGQDQSFLVIQG